MIVDLQRVKSRLTTLTVFHNEVTCLDDDRRAGDVHMHFSKASDTVFITSSHISLQSMG